ncbi:MAG: hypothetical protein ACTSX9_05285 [Candidatus Njordarchaeales archaeon]
MILVSWMRLAPIDIKNIGEKLETLKRNWILEERRYKRIIGDYLVSVEDIPKFRDLINEVLSSLIKPIPVIDEIIDFLQNMESLNRRDFMIRLYGDGRIEYGEFLDWFHGQEIINNLLENLEFRIIRYYDGISKVVTRIERPITHDKLCNAIRRIYQGIKLYYLIKIAQTNAAIQTTILYRNLLPK